MSGAAEKNPRRFQHFEASYKRGEVGDFAKTSIKSRHSIAFWRWIFNGDQSISELHLSYTKLQNVGIASDFFLRLRSYI